MGVLALARGTEEGLCGVGGSQDLRDAISGLGRGLGYIGCIFWTSGGRFGWEGLGFGRCGDGGVWRRGGVFLSDSKDSRGLEVG